MLFDPSRPNNFDLLRFVAATLVLVDHSAVLTGRPGHPGLFAYETLGGFAVAVFFIISGFLVAASWERAPRLGAFALKRALRIIPAYAAVVAFAALVLGPIVTELAPGAYFRNPLTWAYFRNLTFVELYYSLPGVFTRNPFPNAVNGSIWTLPIEVTMYIALAALGWIGLMTRPVVSVLVAALAVGWFGWGAEASAAPPLYFAVLPTGYTLHLALWFFSGGGLLLADWLRDPPPWLRCIAASYPLLGPLPGWPDDPPSVADGPPSGGVSTAERPSPASDRSRPAAQRSGSADSRH